MTAVLLSTLVLLAYASLALELTILHVPSVASTSKIWSRDPALVEAYSPSYRNVFFLPWTKKVVLFVLPVLVAYGVYAYPLVAVVGRTQPLGDHLFNASRSTDALAALAIVFGRGIGLASVVAMRSGTATEGDPMSLRTSGLFRLSRNPGLVGNYIFVTGLWIAAPSITMLAGILLYVRYMHFKVGMEEDYLENRFGAPYRAYRARTARYWP